jgi:hypothetical protein
MSTSIATAPREAGVSPAVLEHTLGTGDLSRLSVQQRVEYYMQVCRNIGVNPLTRPFQFLTFQGKTVMYATKDLTDQLRNIRKITLEITNKGIEGDVYTVTCKATDPEGRHDEDIGAVVLSDRAPPESRANAIMRAMTKAKRRVTLSICGMGFLDESELDTMPGAKIIDHTEEATAPEPPKVAPKRQTSKEWLDETGVELATAPDTDALNAIFARPKYKQMREWLTNGALDRLLFMENQAIERTAVADEDEAEPLFADPETDPFRQPVTA